ncbi:MAG: thioredoxin family protein [Candidatus Muiribacteriaceae bacterium]
MKKTLLIIIVIAASVLLYKNISLHLEQKRSEDKNIVTQTEVAEEAETDKGKKSLPKLMDIGAGTCVPCKMMKPIIEDLQENYSDYFITEYVDLNIIGNKQTAIENNVRAIPTLIFFDADGNEIDRKEGFTKKEEILKIWKTHNIEVGQ